ncbi:hypothetical protein [Sporosarcina sp. OR05]|uniref:hypothetical protein n=1 Tax=Sporosarcina sp. OR05 TaxID=2969819 RepID=UPI00352AA382
MTNEIRRSVARKVTEHTLLAATITLDCYGGRKCAIPFLQEDLHELKQLEPSPLVAAAIEMTEIGLVHAHEPTEATYDKARIARDKLGALMIRVKEIAG